MTFFWSADAAIIAAASLALLATGAIIHRAARGRGRLQHNTRVAWIWLFLLSFIVLIWCAEYYVFSKDFPTASSLFLGSIGILVGVFAIYLTRPNRKKIALIGKAQNSFTTMLLKGAAERLSSEGHFDFAEIYPDEPAFETAHGVTDKLASADARKADAVIVVPGDVDPHLMNEVHALIKRGTTVVVCDARLDEDYFLERGVSPPVYIGCNFMHGGRLIAQNVIDKFQDGDLVFVICGPRRNAPAVERGRAVLYELMLSCCGGNVRAVEIESWHENEIIEKFEKRIMPAAVASQTKGRSPRIFVYCGNDENAMIIDRYIHKKKGDRLASQFYFFGFDGVRDARRQLLIDSSERVIATVDTRPSQIGRCAADAVVQVREGSVYSGRTRIIVDPVYSERKLQQLP